MPRPRAYDESEVMRRARETFHDHGYSATSVEELCAATGLNRSSLYSAFGDKHELFLKTFSQYCAEDAELIQVELAGDDAGGLDRIKAHLRLKTADPTASARGCLLAKLTAEVGASDPEVKRGAERFYAGYQQALSDCVAGAQRTGQLRADIEPAAAGALLLAVLRGIEALGRSGQSKHALQVIADSAVQSLLPPVGAG